MRKSTRRLRFPSLAKQQTEIHTTPETSTTGVFIVEKNDAPVTDNKKRNKYGDIID